MPAQRGPEYPKALFKSDQPPIYANNAKQEDDLAEQGWSADYIHREFPKMLFWPGERKTAIVQNAAEMKSKLAEGWQKVPESVHYGEVDVKPNQPLPVAEAGSQAAELAELRQTVAEQQRLINSILIGEVDLPKGKKEPKGKKAEGAA